MEMNEERLVSQLKDKNVKAFDFIFKKYYPLLVVFAHRYISRTDICEEIVQDIFLKIWENAEVLGIRTPVKPYLTTMIKNKCIDYLRTSNLSIRYEKETRNLPIDSSENHTDEAYMDKLEKVKTEINKLPRQRKRIFKMSRYYGMKYAEIATKLNISYKTVENQMGSAIKQIRKNSKDFS